MTLAILAEIPGLTREDYERVVKKVKESGSPAGALLHAGGPMEGGYRIVEVWETREAADAFYGSALYREATASITTEPKVVMTWPVHGLWTTVRAGERQAKEGSRSPGATSARATHPRPVSLV